jgi:hypothetical protein
LLALLCVEYNMDSMLIFDSEINQLVLCRKII